MEAGAEPRLVPAREVGAEAERTGLADTRVMTIPDFDFGGRYYNNDSGAFSAPHPAADNHTTPASVARTIDEMLARLEGTVPRP